MSMTTGMCGEVIYQSKVTGTQLNTFTAEASLHGTMPPAVLRAGLLSREGQKLRISATGRLGTTGAPTFTWTLRILTSGTWSAAGITVATAALTAGTTQTLAPWKLEIDVILRTLGAPGASSTLYLQGFLFSPLGLASPFMAAIPGNSGTNTAATFDPEIANYVFLSATCGTSSGSNLIQLEDLTVYGDN